MSKSPTSKPLYFLTAILFFAPSFSRADAPAPPMQTTIASEAPTPQTEAVGAAAFTAATLPETVAQDEGIALPATVDTVTERLLWIQRQLDDRRSYAAWWKYGFMGVFGGAAIFQGISYYYLEGDDLSEEEKELKNDALVGAIMAGLGVGGMVISPVDGGGVATELDDYRASVTDAVAKLAYAELLLYETALDEQAGRDWFQYAQMFIASSASAGVMWFYYDQPLSAGLKFVSGVGASTARILLTPTQATNAWEAYQRRFTPALGAYRVEPVWGLDVSPEFVAVRLYF